MHIIIDFDENKAGRFVALDKRRLALVGGVCLALLALVTYGLAFAIAERWAKNKDPRLIAIVRAETAEREADKNRLWEAGVGSLRKNMAEVNARLIALSKQGEAIANYIGAEETLPLPNAPETAGLCPAVENNAAAPQAGGGPEEDISRLGGLLFEQSAAAEQIGRAYDALSFLGSQKRMLEKTTPMRNPVLGKNWLASRFGYRKDPFTGRRAFHAGTDYAARRGTPVAAAASGIVIYVGRLGNYGNAVHLYHGDDVSSLYGHLKEAHVELFQYVSQGEQIGEVGSTGRSTGPHLHYEVRIKNRSRPLTKTLRNLRQRRGLS